MYSLVQVNLLIKKFISQPFTMDSLESMLIGVYMEAKIFDYVIDGRIPSYIKQSNDFIEIPFKINDSIDILFIEFTTLETECRLGVGIADSNGYLRGWSAERKSKIYIAKGTATPGYIPGDIPSGMWKIIIRLDSMASNGCRYRLRVAGFRTVLGSIRFEDVSRTLSYLTKNINLIELIKNYLDLIPILNYTYPCKDYSNEFEGARNIDNGPMWYKGDLHTHSIHSDGRNTVCELIMLARTRGLNFIALTDHNTIAQNYEPAIYRYREPLVIPGMEITTFYGHINVFNIKKYIDFRRRNRDDFKKLIDEVHSDGGLISVNHPDLFREFMCKDCPFRYRDVEGFDAIEVWNGPWYILNNESLLWWHTLLTKGYRVTAIGGSDYHGVDLTRLGEPTTWVYADNLTIESILHGIKLGRVNITYSPEKPLINIRALANNGNIYMIGDSIKKEISNSIVLTIDVRKAKGSTLRIITPQDVYKAIEISEDNFRYREKIDVSNYNFIRVEIGIYSDSYKLIPHNYDDVLALTNPLYIE